MPAGSLGDMNDDQPHPVPEDTWDEDELLAQQRPERTGLPRVDAVIDAIADLGGLPLEEQVAAFEAAHNELRGTLDQPDPTRQG